MELALIAGGWLDDEPHCWLPTQRGYLCYGQPRVIPTLEEAQACIQAHARSRQDGVSCAMTASRLVFDAPVEVVLQSGVRTHIDT